jgi:hypothetical protein
MHIFMSILYMFRATLCVSSGESIVSIQHLVYVTGDVARFERCAAPDDGHKVARNMYRIEINMCIQRSCASSWFFIGIIPRCTVTRENEVKCVKLEEKFQMCSYMKHYKKKQIRDKKNFVDW